MFLVGLIIFLSTVGYVISIFCRLYGGVLQIVWSNCMHYLKSFPTLRQQVFFFSSIETLSLFLVHVLLQFCEIRSAVSEKGV